MDRIDQESAWGYNVRGETRMPAAVATVIAGILYLWLPTRFTIGPAWLLPLFLILLLIPLLTFSWRREANEKPWHRIMAILLIVIINVYNIASLILLLFTLTHPESRGNIMGINLLLAAAQIWFTNMIVFGLWYWELDRGGPSKRSQKHHRNPDFLFPQMATPLAAPKEWAPLFLDYLYISFTNATAFSPTDTLPLTRLAKTLMGLQALTSLVTVALVAARAVNILS